MDFTAAAAALEASAFGVWMRSSAQAYPVANLVHLLGLVLLVGGIGVVDLRLLGFGRKIPLVPLSRFLTPLAIAGVVLMLASGVMLFAADAVPLLRAPMFGWKLAFIGLAILNAVGFQLLWRGRLAAWADTPPPAARVMAACSLGLWLAAATLGRLLAYS